MGKMGGTTGSAAASYEDVARSKGEEREGSMSETNLRGHTGKHRFPNEESARREIARMVIHKGADIFRINPYPCSICKEKYNYQYWHIGNRNDYLLEQVAPTAMKRKKEK